MRIRPSLLVTLGLLSGLTPFAIDMYLPALPSIGKDLGAGTTAVQMSLLAFFLAVGCGQIFVGPISDMYGRKAPLAFGLILFAVGALIGCFVFFGTLVVAKAEKTYEGSIPLVVFGAVVVVSLNTALSHVLARRGVGWSNTLGQFLVVLGANFTAVFLYRALPGTRDLDEAAVTRRAAVGRDDAVLRLLGLADSGEAQLDCHNVLGSWR